MWVIIIIIVVVAFVLIKFLYAKEELKKNVEIQGGMLNKYKVLISYLKGNDPNTKTFKVTSDEVIIGQNGPSGSTVFIITQLFGSVNIKWKIESIVFGKHGLEWNFNEYKDQNEIAEIIHRELSIYQKNVMS